MDALRGLAALWVVLFHAFSAQHMAHLEPMLPNGLTQLMRAGYLGVAVFFVLSGFVIAHSVGRHRVDAPYIGWFALRRSVRLDVPYWASIVVIIGLRPDMPSAPTMLAHMFYVQDLLHIEPLSSIYWTLCLEMQLYVVFILLLGIAGRVPRRGGNRRALLVVFSLAAVVAAAWPLGLVPEGAPLAGLFLPRWYAFLVGVFACWAVDGTLSRSTFYVYAGALLAGAIRFHNIDALVSIPTAALLLEVGRAGKLLHWLSWRPLQFLGKISYSLYLMHGPIAVVTLRYTLYRLTPRTAAWELFWLVVLLGVTTSGAWLFWRLVEKPCMTLSQRCKPSAQVAVA